MEQFFKDDQRDACLKYIEKIMIERQKAFEVADDELYGKTTGGTQANNSTSQNKKSTTGHVKKPHKYQAGTVAL